MQNNPRKNYTKYMIKITSTNDVIIVEGDELTRHYPNNGTLVIPKNSTLVVLDEKSEMVLFKSASNYDTLFTGILGSISIEDEIVTRENIIEKFNTISNVNVGGNVDLFEVVQSLPTENISDNKVYLVLDSNGSEGNTYVEYLYVNGQWEELGKFKVNVDLSGYATKEELNTKQDTISDLETIRSGASKGATALQSVPDTYAKKTDILSAKTDTRYTTYDVENAVLSGNTILLQNEVTDSRKYHTFGYEKTITASVPVTKYINITRDYNGVPSMDTDIESEIEFTDFGGGVYGMCGDIPFTLDKINAVTNILHYEVSYAERDSENNVTGGGETIVDDVIYDPNTKLLSVSDGRFSFAQIRKSDNGQHIFGGNTDGNEYLENGRWYYNFEQHPLQEGVHLIFEPYYSSNLYWDFSVTINNMFYGEGSVTTNDKPERLNDYIRYANNVKAYILTDKNTTFKTINGQQITGNGNIEIAKNVPTVQTTVEGTTNNYIYSSGKVDKYGVISDISNIITYSTDKASIKTYIYYWGSTSTNVSSNWEINGATTSKAGFMSASDKSKLDGIDITTKQDVLVSGTNIKTVNGISLLGEGNITISGEGGADLSGYYTKAEIDAMIGGASTTITQINNLVG